MPKGIFKRTKHHLRNFRIKVSGERNCNWRGGKCIHTDGYITILTKNRYKNGKKKYILEHRLVMQEYIGRKLNNKEVVHHINGIKSDNRIENLKLFSSVSEHTKHHGFRNGNTKMKRRCFKCKRIKFLYLFPKNIGKTLDKSYLCKKCTKIINGIKYNNPIFREKMLKLKKQQYWKRKNAKLTSKTANGAK
jgi:hypothetical protein